MVADGAWQAAVDTLYAEAVAGETAARMFSRSIVQACAEERLALNAPHAAGTFLVCLVYAVHKSVRLSKQMSFCKGYRIVGGYRSRCLI